MYYSKAPFYIDKLSVQYSRSSGPGGQNVNKVNTKVDIRFTVYDMEWVPQPVVQRILEQNQGRMNKKGELVVTSDRFRTQHMNYNDCIDKIYDLIAAASQVSDGPSTSTLRRVDHL
ncbi:hypothetical protein BATDEDRAFT_13116 [Batrachochytrium dendrobatidis JAM81]|uniref:Prokaryotic-type class I peptide chain release factors domain-containing protein n=1 Tax=Batrachochytrium dendrobatidis (strain JAM81 / FGSC 10211) TaxID=684364 RepID=F4P7Y9_BATDJ|nr:uncharacterized protein BATDEDRAFT_13116 [Batrachochytrium dendrobatidis JAM81]EGF78657.1 hypothetical protein BATDEDRAFT_13116 [Batrachochytrium dendrobatidis JAM81]|eukprot:XP_006680634.1 hypothetical protein BATDEDRAFT_13116 [Batrachochytrium dendrobatidis JAM81]